MISFACPNCGKRLTVNDEIAGKKGTCKGCKQVILVPTIPARVNSPATRHETNQAGASYQRGRRLKLESLAKQLEAVPEPTEEPQQTTFILLLAIAQSLLASTTCEGDVDSRKALDVARETCDAGSNVLGKGHQAILIMRRMVAIACAIVEGRKEIEDVEPRCARCGCKTGLKEFNYCGYEREEESIVNGVLGSFKQVNYLGVHNLTEWVCEDCIANYRRRWWIIGATVGSIALAAGIPGWIALVKNWASLSFTGHLKTIPFWVAVTASIAFLAAYVMVWRNAFDYVDLGEGRFGPAAGEVLALKANRKKLEALGCKFTCPGHKGSKNAERLIAAMKRLEEKKRREEKGNESE